MAWQNKPEDPDHVYVLSKFLLARWKSIFVFKHQIKKAQKVMTIFICIQENSYYKNFSILKVLEDIIYSSDSHTFSPYQECSPQLEYHSFMSKFPWHKRLDFSNSNWTVFSINLKNSSKLPGQLCCLPVCLQQVFSPSQTCTHTQREI